jgi:peptidyl-prolyl cis-trans isomerase-like 3
MAVTLHTTHGNIKLEVFCDQVPKTAEVTSISQYDLIIQGLRPPHLHLFDAPNILCLAETFLRRVQNFLALCASNYFDGVIFHRNMKGEILSAIFCLTKKFVPPKLTTTCVHSRLYDSDGRPNW